MLAGDRGKPRLACSDLFFSASRTTNIALYATSWRMGVGVDIEAIRTIADVDGIVAGSCRRRATSAGFSASGPPSAGFLSLLDPQRGVRQGHGHGTRRPACRPRCLARRPATATVSGWSIHQVDVSPGYAAAVAEGTLASGVRRFLTGSSPRAWLIHIDHRQANPRALVAQGG